MSENGDVLYPLGGSRQLDSTFGEFRDGKSAFIPYPSDSQIFHGHPSEYKISFPASMEAQIRKLKITMEPWRDVIVEVNNVLLWQKPWHSTALFSVSTAVFLSLFMMNPSTLSLLSFIGLLITLADCFLPAVLMSMFKPESWTKEQQKQYEEVCTNMIMYKTKIELICSSYYRMRVTNTKVYCSLTIFTFCVLIWIGSTIDNMFLMYLICTFLLMLPGMLQRGMLGKISETCSKLFNDLIENAKSKVGNGKKLQ